MCVCSSLWGTSSCSLYGGLAPTPMTEHKSQGLQVMGALPPAGVLAAGIHQGLALGSLGKVWCEDSLVCCAGTYQWCQG